VNLPANIIEFIFNNRIEHLFLTYLKLRNICTFGHIKTDINSKKIYADTIGVSISTLNRHLIALDKINFIEKYNDDIKHVKSIYAISVELNKVNNIKTVGFPFDIMDFQHSAIGEFSAILHELIIEKIIYNKNVDVKRNSIEATIQNLIIRAENLTPFESKIKFHVGKIKEDVTLIKSRISKLNWMNKNGNYGKSHQDIIDSIIDCKKELDGLKKQLLYLEIENSTYLKEAQSLNKVDEEFKSFNDGENINLLSDSLNKPFNPENFDEDNLPSNADNLTNKQTLRTINNVAYSYAAVAVNRSVTTIQKYRAKLIDKGIANRKILFLNKTKIDVEKGLNQFNNKKDNFLITYVQPFETANDHIPLYEQNEDKENSKVIKTSKGTIEVHSTERQSKLKVKKKRFLGKIK
jgi:predicted transcriptional regulator